MAYVASSTEEDDANKKSINLGDSALDAGSSAGTGLGPSEGAGGSGISPSSGSGFVGINDYLANNKEGSADLGNTVAGGIGSTINSANQAINTGANTFANQANANKVDYNDAAVDRTINTGNADADFNKLISGTYSGPKTWAEAGVQSQADAAVQAANERATLANTQGGRTQLLQQIIDRPMTFGSGNLNSALLSGNEGAVTNVKNTAATAAPLASNLTAAQTASANLAGQVAGNNANVKTQTIGKLTNYLTAADQAQAQAVQAANATQAQKDAAAQAYLSELNKQAASQTFTAKPLVVANPGETIEQASARIAAERAANLVKAGAGDTVGSPTAQVTGTGQALLPAGWEQAGLSQEQAQNLANAILAANKVGATPTLNGYYNAGQPITNTLSAADAQRYNALANIAGLGQKYTAGNVAGGAFDINGALANIEQQRANGQQVLNNAADAAAAAFQQNQNAQTAQAFINANNRSGSYGLNTYGNTAGDTAEGLSDGSKIGQYGFSASDVTSAANDAQNNAANPSPSVLGMSPATAQTVSKVASSLIGGLAGTALGMLANYAIKTSVANQQAAAANQTQYGLTAPGAYGSSVSSGGGSYGYGLGTGGSGVGLSTSSTGYGLGTGNAGSTNQAGGWSTGLGNTGLGGGGNQGSGSPGAGSNTGASAGGGSGSTNGNSQGGSKGGSDSGDANGGLIVGPGTGTSDSMVRGASNGEYVIPADVVQKYGVDFFHKLLNDHTPVDTSANNTSKDRPMAKLVNAKQENNATSPFADRVLSGLAGKNISRDLSSPEDTGAADNRLIQQYESQLGRPLTMEEVVKLKNVNFERNKAIKETNRNATPEGQRIDTERVKPSVDYKEQNPLFQKTSDAGDEDLYANASPFGKTPTPAEQEMIDAVRRGQTKGGVPASIPRSKIASGEEDVLVASNAVPIDPKATRPDLSPALKKALEEEVRKQSGSNGQRNTEQYLRSLGIL